MPFPAVEALRAALGGDGLELLLRGGAEATERRPLVLVSGDGATFINRDEILFSRRDTDAAEALTDWEVWRGETLLAHDQVDTPFILRRGERATMPVGALRLKLR